MNEQGSPGDRGAGGGRLGRYLVGWEPAPVHQQDLINTAAPAALAALLDGPSEALVSGNPLPPLWHWLFFLEWPAQHQLGSDGHPRAGGFVPPLPHRRRMFAGGRVRMVAPPRMGVPAERRSALVGTDIKQGRAGELLLVSVRHEIWQAGECRIVDEQDLVYRSGERTDSGRPAPATQTSSAPPTSSARWQLPLVADPVLLFRFSALTANAHRIHYDEPYTREVEQFPGLVVHGPLLAVLMLELMRRNRPDRAVTSVTYRLRRPVYAGEPVLVTGTPVDATTVDLAVLGPEQQPRAVASVELGPAHAPPPVRPVQSSCP